MGFYFFICHKFLRQPIKNSWCALSSLCRTCKEQEQQYLVFTKALAKKWIYMVFHSIIKKANIKPTTTAVDALFKNKRFILDKMTYQMLQKLIYILNQKTQVGVFVHFAVLLYISLPWSMLTKIRKIWQHKIERSTWVFIFQKYGNF